MDLTRLLIFSFVAITLAGFAYQHSGFDTLDTSIDQPSSIMRTLTHHELNSQVWSQDALTLRGSDGVMHVFSNYTIDHDGTSRWTKRHAQRSVERRAFALSGDIATWDYKPRNLGIQWRLTPVFVRLCFPNAQTKLQLGPAVYEALCRWETALGTSAGFAFSWDSNSKQGTDQMCSFRSNKHHTTLWINYDAKNKGETTIGKVKGPSMRIGKDPYPTLDQYSLTDAITHEIGVYYSHVHNYTSINHYQVTF